jgi:uncharacterized membrane protein (DUF485 family)
MVIGKSKFRRINKKKNFKNIFKEELRYGLAAAIGFLIAYAWREPLLLFFEDIVINTTKLNSHYSTNIISALLITFFGVLFLWIISEFLR